MRFFGRRSLDQKSASWTGFFDLYGPASVWCISKQLHGKLPSKWLQVYLTIATHLELD
jgi:hypothetical protein